MSIFISKGGAASCSEPSESQVSEGINLESLSQKEARVTSGVIDNWKEFKIPVNKFSKQINLKLDRGEGPLPSEIREVIRIVVAEAMAYCSRRKAYGAIEYCPELATNETDESQEQKKITLLEEYKRSPWDFPKVLRNRDTWSLPFNEHQNTCRHLQVHHLLKAPFMRPNDRHKRKAAYRDISEVKKPIAGCGDFESKATALQG
ncbi:hypothetical protein JTE90_025557 [Oedothorax gibbosus]|uniref:Uncharacterized protein n=1 Tax=Oedothorax gibbosus TaxID=931172 RepID=A0AAV6TWI0_9ARAC|nr:hypothetical protein JTE90_025557 [Oedothorax gibbosus]